MVKNVVIKFDLCLQDLFFKDFEDLKKTKKIPGYESISLETINNNLEVTLPCYIEGSKSNFVFLIPTKIFKGKLCFDPDTFFKRGLCKIPNKETSSIFVFNGEYQKENKALVGSIDHYYPGSLGWNMD